MALEQNLAEPLSLATADFDEDGVPDLVGGYGYDGRGIITVHRGNVDAIYPNAPEAKRRKVEGIFTDAPFLSPARVFDLPVAADFLGAGDFDADGHWDAVVGSRSHAALFFLSGNGLGELALTREIHLPGLLTAMTTGEINRRDGLTDIVLGLSGDDGPRVFVFEGPLGAMRAEPEVFAAPEIVTSVALGQIDDFYPMDLAFTSGHDLCLVHGRDRKLSLSAEDQATVPAASVSERSFAFGLRALSIGEFTGDGFSDVALLTDQGSLEVLSQPGISLSEWNELKARALRDQQPSKDLGVATNQGTQLPSSRARNEISQWPQETRLSGGSLYATSFVNVRISTSATDDLLALDSTGRQIQVIQSRPDPQVKGAGSAPPPMRTDISLFNADRAPIAVLPMRLDMDALHDLVVLRSQGAPTIALTTNANGDHNAPQSTPGYVSFSNTTSIGVSSSSATPYPSAINVSGLTGTIDKLRVRLNNMSSNFGPEDYDILLVGPAGQKVMLMSDVGSCCVVDNATITFDDEASSSLQGIRVISGTYKPTDENTGPDVLPSPAPAGPYGNLLSAFNNTNGNGVWNLYANGDSGFANATIAGGWTLYFGPDTPATFDVTNTNDSGAGSLRQAILDANASLGADIITFHIGSGPQTITPASALPDVTEAVTIDATTQPGFAGSPLIEIDGTNTGPFAGQTNGVLNIRGGRSTVRGLVINRYNTGAIALFNNGNNIIEGNFVGTDVTGTISRSNILVDGIAVDTANNLIGGTTPQARNLISGVSYGVIFSTFNDDPATLNIVAGNFIGTDVTGTKEIGISHAGVSTNSAPGSPNNTIGGTTAGSRNLISDSGTGVDLTYAASGGTLVQGNYIGPSVTGTSGLSSFTSQIGVELSAGVGDCLVGGTTPAARNLISRNMIAVMLNTNNISSPPPVRNLVQGNFIGTDVNGTSRLENTWGIQLIFGASQNTIGGAVVEARNIISGNLTGGIQVGEINFSATFTNVIQNNYIGTDVTGNNPLPNGPSGPFCGSGTSGHGIQIPANADGDRIEGNRIAYNKGAGVRITNAPANNQPGLRIQIINNEIFANCGLGIDLGDTGITPNDPLDADSGPNFLQNFPVLTSAIASAAPGETVWERGGQVGREMPDPILVAALTINGTLNSTPNTNFTVHWYFSADAQCSTNQAGSRPLTFGKVPNVITDSSGNAVFSIPFDFPSGITGGIVNCTATDPQGNTSEFSACFPVGTSPGPTPTPTPTPTPIPTPTPSPRPCAGFSETFDAMVVPAIPPGWSATNASGPAPLWVTSNGGVLTPVADSTPNAVFVDDPGVVSDKRFDSPPIALTSGSAQLAFRQNRNLENSFDGGVLEISIGGAAFQDIVAAGGSFVAGGYNATLSSSFANPLAGRQAWSGNSNGFVTTTVNLPPSAGGQNIVLRWRLGSDNAVSGQGWRIDNVAITCASPPTIYVEDGTNNLAAVDSVTFVRGPFTLANAKNFSSDQRTRILFFTTSLGLPQTSQPALNTLSVQVGGNSYTVDSVGPNTTTGGSNIVFRLPDLSPGTYPLGVRLNGVNSTNTPNLTIVSSPSSPAAPKSNKAKLAEYLLFPLFNLFF